MARGFDDGKAKGRFPVLPVVLGLIMLLFIGILVFAYVATDSLHPVILDEKGVPR